MDIVQMLIDFLSKYPAFATVIFVVGAFRVVFKPLVSIVHAYVDYTPDQKDNEALAKVESSAIYKAVVYFVDYIASIKLPK